MPTLDTVIKGGTVIDGLRTPRYQADIGIKDGRVASIGAVNTSDAAKVLDASGMIVAPGFVDLHTHYDSQVFWDPWCSISGWHGVTSVVIGNCGFGFAPVKPKDQDRAMLTMARNEAVPLATMQEGMPWDWETYPEFLESLERTPKGVNLLSYLGLNPLLVYVMGIEEKGRAASDEEMARMCQILEEAMEVGCCGFSTQLSGEGSVQRDYDGTPMITDVMPHDDVIKLARVLKKVGRGFIQGAGVSRELTEALCQASGRPVMSGLGVTTDQHGQPMANYKEQMQWLEDANSRGNRVFAQLITAEVGFEFTLEDWNLFDSSPHWRDITLGDVPTRIAKMSDPERRAALREEFDAGKGPIAGGGTEERVGGVNVWGVASMIVESVEKDELRDCEGLTIAEVAERTGKHPIDAMLDLAVADQLQTTFVTPPRERSEGEMAAIKEVCNSSFALPGVSDGGAHTKFITLGAYTTEYLTKLVRDAGVMDLEQAHWRLSTYPALAAGIKDRGWIREDAPADIIVYDYENLALQPQEKAFDFPANEWRRVRKATGYRWTLVNGEVTFEEGECTGVTPGRVLRHGTA